MANLIADAAPVATTSPPPQGDEDFAFTQVGTPTTSPPAPPDEYEALVPPDEYEGLTPPDEYEYDLGHDNQGPFDGVFDETPPAPSEPKVLTEPPRPDEKPEPITQPVSFLDLFADETPDEHEAPNEPEPAPEATSPVFVDFSDMFDTPAPEPAPAAAETPPEPVEEPEKTDGPKPPPKVQTTRRKRVRRKRSQ